MEEEVAWVAQASDGIVEAGPFTGDRGGTLTLDAEAHAVLLDAVELYHRVQSGQWRHLAEACGTLLGPQAGPFAQAADELMGLRCRFAVHPVLRDNPDASLGVLQSGRPAVVAYDLWHALGGGMETRRADRWSGAQVEFRPCPAPAADETAAAAADVPADRVRP